MTEFYIDADACPVKDEVFKVGRRYGLVTHVVSNSWIRVPLRDPLIRSVVVDAGPDVADDWIAARAGPGDVVITQDIPLADRVLKAGGAGDQLQGSRLHGGQHRLGARLPLGGRAPAVDGRGHQRPGAFRATGSVALPASARSGGGEGDAGRAVRLAFNPPSIFRSSPRSGDPGLDPSHGPAVAFAA